jgi:polysaccharide export outer membrane protein
VINRLFTYIFLSLIVSFSLLSFGCSTTPEPKIIEQDSPVVERQSVEVDERVDTSPPFTDYTVGPGDVLFVNVSGKSEFSSSILPGQTALKGSRVDGNGKIHIPLVGSVYVSGRTVEQLQEELKKKYSHYIKDPWIIVEITEHKSKPLYLLGQFRNPGVYYIDRPTNVIQAIAYGNGLNPTANLRGARILRNKKLLPVDIYDLLMHGDMTQNIWLDAGDSIYAPDSKEQSVFILGLVGKPGQINMIHGKLTLLQALSAAGFDEKTSYSSDIRIIRSHSPTKGELIVVDLDKILSGESGSFFLMEGDIVFVAHSGIGNWNKALNEILPSLQTVSAILQPFVQIKYLSQ